MVLAKDETLIKEWEYGKSSEWKFFGAETKYSLAVTDKRIVASSKSRKKNSREEISVKDVKGVSVAHNIPSILSAIILMSIGVLYLLFCIIYLTYEDLGVFGILMMPVAVILIIWGITRLNQGSITISIITDGPKSVSLALGLAKMTRRISGGGFRVKIDNQVAEEIVETLGTLIINMNG